MNKIVLVTGGMGGLGTAICSTLASQGYNVIVTYSGNEEKAKKWHAHMQERGLAFKAYKCNVADYASCSQMVQQIKVEVGVIDILINNAGITRDFRLAKMTKDVWDIVLRTNLDSIFNMTKPVLDGMIEKEWGRIINISSINGQKGQFGQVNYSAAKAGIHGFTMALAQEVANHGITVNTIAPGYMETEMVMKMPVEIRDKIIAQIPIGRLGKPEEVAALVSYLASELSAFMTGSIIPINGGQHMM